MLPDPMFSFCFCFFFFFLNYSFNLKNVKTNFLKITIYFSKNNIFHPYFLLKKFNTLKFLKMKNMYIYENLTVFLKANFLLIKTWFKLLVCRHFEFLTYFFSSFTRKKKRVQT